MSTWPENNPIAKPWECKACGHVNKGYHKECRQCGHEPILGSTPDLLQKWHDSHTQEGDS